MSKFYKQLIFISLGAAILIAGGVLVFSMGDKGAAPIAQWKFDEGSGNYAYDSSGNGNTGSLSLGGSATSSAWVSGVYGTALSFDGTDDYVSVSNSITMATGSLSFWAKPNTTTQKLIELSASDYVSLASGIVTVAGFGTEVVYVDGRQTTVFPDTNWHHIAIVSSVAITANTVNLGKNGATYYAGLLDDVRIYNYARTANQIKRDYNEGKAMYVGVRAPASCDVDPASCVNKGLVGYWDMDQMGGQTASDKSGNANNGTLGAATTLGADDPVWTKGVQPFSGGRPGGGTLSFDGVDDYVNQSVSGFRSTDNVGTVCAWIKLNQIGVTQYVISSADEGTEDYTIGPIRIDSTNKASIYQLSTGVGDLVLGDTTLTSGTWYHICSQSNGTSYSIFVNSHQEILTVSTGSNTGDWFYDTLNRDNLTIGVSKRNSGLVCLFNGLIDDVRIYNRVLSATEIQYQYNQAKPIAWWKMDEGADTATTCNATISSVYDYSGQGNTGTLHNANATPATSSMWSDGKYGCALTFDGVDDYVGVSNSIAMATGTLAFWAKPDTTTQKLIELSASDYVSLASGVVTVAGFGAEVVYVDGRQTTVFPDTNWHHISIVSLASITANTVNLGKNSATYYAGLLDDVRIYNYARAANQIRADYNSGTSLHLGQ